MSTSAQTQQTGSATIASPWAKRADRSLYPNLLQNVSSLTNLQGEMSPELALQALNSGQLSGAFAGLTDSPALRTLLQNAIDQNKANNNISGLSSADMASYLSGERVLPSAWQDQVNQLYKGEEDQAMANLRQYGTELSGARGMNLSDSPVSYPLMQQMQLLQSKLASERANATLNLGNQLFQNAQAANDFQNRLRLQAQANRSQLAGLTPGSGNTLAATPAIGQMGSRTDLNTPSLMSTISGGLQGIGQMGQGFGNFFATPGNGGQSGYNGMMGAMGLGASSAGAGASEGLGGLSLGMMAL